MDQNMTLATKWLLPDTFLKFLCCFARICNFLFEDCKCILVKVISMLKTGGGEDQGRRLTKTVADPVFSGTSTFIANFLLCSGGEGSLHWASVCTTVTSAVRKTYWNGIKQTLVSIASCYIFGPTIEWYTIHSTKIIGQFVAKKRTHI